MTIVSAGSNYKPKQCNWQGYGFGAPYQDAACNGKGEIGDLDGGDAPGEMAMMDEVCPQCDGTGVAKRTCGPMALHRKRFFDEFDSDLKDAIDTTFDSSDYEEFSKKIKQARSLVQLLEAAIEEGRRI